MMAATFHILLSFCLVLGRVRLVLCILGMGHACFSTTPPLLGPWALAFSHFSSLLFFAFTFGGRQDQVVLLRPVLSGYLVFGMGDGDWMSGWAGWLGPVACVSTLSSSWVSLRGIALYLDGIGG